MLCHHVTITCTFAAFGKSLVYHLLLVHAEYIPANKNYGATTTRTECSAVM
jgi:hypothetical protein